MHNSRIIGAIALFLFFVFANPILSFCQENINPSDIRTVTGEVEMVDSLHSCLLIRWVDDLRTMSKDEMYVSVSKTTSIIKGTSPQKIDQINIGDRVTVRYHHESMGWPRALTIVVKN